MEDFKMFKRSDYTGFTVKIFKTWIEFVFLKGFPITIALNFGKQTGKTYRILDLNHLFIR